MRVHWEFLVVHRLRGTWEWISITHRELESRLYIAAGQWLSTNAVRSVRVHCQYLEEANRGLEIGGMLCASGGSAQYGLVEVWRFWLWS